MKLWKRLAAGLLAMVTAIGATISAGASKKAYYFTPHKEEKMEDGSTYLVDGESLRYYGDVETIKTLVELGTIENFGDPETETPVLIPASQLENYPVGTIVSYSVSSIGTSQAEYPVAYVTDGNRTYFQQTCGIDDEQSAFIITKEMKESGILFTGYMLTENSTTAHRPATIQSVKFSNAVASEYEYKGNLFYSYRSYTPDGGTIIGFYPDELSDIPAGAEINCTLYGFTYTGDPYNDRFICELISDELHYTYNSNIGSGGYGWVGFMLTEEMKSLGFAIIIPSIDVSVIGECFSYSGPKEGSEIDPVDPVDPVEKSGFSSAGSSIKDVPVDTVVTQKTAVSDEKYNERFVKKVAASDVVGKTKATFTLSNGTVTKTVSTTKYNTALTVDGETIPAGSGYVFLVYTLSGIPEDVTVTVSDVVLE